MSDPTPSTLLTLQEARDAVSVAGSTPTAELSKDDLVQRYIDAVVPVIEDLSRPVTQVNRSKAVDGGRDAVLLPWPFLELVSVVVDGAAVDVDDVVPAGDIGIVYRGKIGVTWPEGRRNIVVTVTVGATSIPGNQKLAAGMLFAHLWRTRQGPRPRFNETGGDAVYTPAGFAVPNAVAELLVATPRLPGFA